MARRVDVLDYTRVLAGGVEDSVERSKGERTRLRVKAAAAVILAEKGYLDLRMADVAVQAGLSHGAVYRYFDNKRELTFEVLSEHGEWMLDLLLPAGEAGSAYQRIHSSTQQAVDLFRANVGLMRCTRQLGDQYPEFDELAMRNNARWYRLVASGIARRLGGGSKAQKEAFGTASALGGMVDEMLHNVYVREDPTLAHLRRAPRKLATLLSVLWYRGAYGEEPPSDGEDRPGS